jgi:hypothetical protein
MRTGALAGRDGFEGARWTDARPGVQQRLRRSRSCDHDICLTWVAMSRLPGGDPGGDSHPGPIRGSV